MRVNRRKRQSTPAPRGLVPQPEPNPAPFAWRDALGWAALVCATVAVYLPAMRGGLLWDDNMHVTHPDLRSLHGLWRIWSDLGATQQYYPLLHSAFWLEYRLWGDAVAGYHLTNVLLHATSAFLLALIVRRLALPGAWLAGFVFALHPVCVESVAWISEQKSALSGVFYLAAALAYLYFDRTRKRRHYLLALGLFVLALLSKTVTATLPAVLLVVFWSQRRRLEWRRDVLPLAPWLAIGAAAGLFTAWVERSPQFIGAQGQAYELTLAQHALLAGRVPWFYAAKTLWPADLMFVYPRWKLDPDQAWQWAFPIALVALAAALVWLARRNRAPLAGFMIFTGTLFPVLGFLNVYPFRYSYVADHFQYLACLGIIVPAAAGLTMLARRLAPGRAAGVAAAALLLVPMAWATWRQSAAYRDYETLFRETLARNPESALVRNNLGVMLMSSGREPDALAQFEEAVRLAPDAADYLVNLGLALSHAPGRMAEAIEAYQRALRLDPHLASAYLNLGLAYTAIPGRMADAIAAYRQAIAEYEKAVRKGPSLWEAHLNLALAYGQMPGREGEAIAEFQTALRMKSDSAMAQFHLGNTYHKIGRLPEAIAAYRASLAIDPDVPESHYELAYALAQVPGGVPEALVECRRMLQLKPGDEAGRKLLASLVEFQQGPGR